MKANCIVSMFSLRSAPPIKGLLFCMLFLPSVSAYALDIVKLSKPQSRKDMRVTYKLEVLQTALTLTEAEFGPYRITDSAPPMKRKRALGEMVAGQLINVYIGPEASGWLERTKVIPIPLRQGILSYRLLLINREDLPLFDNITNIDQLKQLQAGLQSGWAITQVFSNSGFRVVRGVSYDGLFHMLDRKRFNYIPRGVHEIYDELSLREAELNNVMVEPNLVLYMPTKSFTYVSPKASRLARRLERGYRKMLARGDFKRIFNKYYLDDVKRARLDERRLIFVDDHDAQEVLADLYTR